jgi:CubicO group peptidase (beta-lactamase class C family)
VTNRAAALVRALVADGRVPGAALCVVDGEGPRLEVYAGSADLAGDVPVDAGTRFALASLTKPLVAAGALVAVEEGIVELDVPIADGLPGAAAGLTFRTCLAHCSGLPADLPARALPPEPTWGQLARACVAVVPVAPPSTRRIYSNVGYAIVGAALEQASGMAIADYLTAAVLGPLGMTATTLGLPPPAAAATVREPGLWAHGVPLFNAPWFRAQALPQSGGFATARDYATFLRCVLRGGRAAGGALLAPETCAELVSNQGGALPGGVDSFMTWPRADWGCGFELRDDKEEHWTGAALSRRAATHFGASGTLCFVDPEHDVAACLLANRGTYGGWMRGPGGWAEIVAAILAP